MEYLPFAVGVAGIVLIASSLGYFDFIGKLLPKKVVSNDSLGGDVIGKFVEIRKMLIGKVDDATLASVDKVILDAVSGAAKNEK